MANEQERTSPDLPKRQPPPSRERARGDPDLPPIEQDVDPWWRAYRETGQPWMRDRLIEHYYPLVRQAAEQIKARLPAQVDLEDLAQAGSLGLIDAIEKYDPDRGAKFETFCSLRIRGAMYDDLRRCDWVPRQIRNRGHQLERARDEAETRLQRVATDEEVAAHMDVPMDEYQELVREQRVRTMVSLDRTWEDEKENEHSHLEALTDHRTPCPLDRVEREELKQLAYRGLSRNEQAILQMYYYDNMSLKEIGVVLQISESRVCQIHQQTLNRLREKFSVRGLEPE